MKERRRWKEKERQRENKKTKKNKTMQESREKLLKLKAADLWLPVSDPVGSPLRFSQVPARLLYLQSENGKLREVRTFSFLCSTLL